MSDENKLIIEPVEFKRAAPDKQRSLLSVNPVTLSVGLVFFMLALAALFMFNARAVQISSTPVADSVEIVGMLPTYKLGDRYLMISGDYEVSLRSEGYHPLKTSFTVSSEPEQEIEFEMIPLPGILDISARWNEQPIEGVDVFLDQEPRGLTKLHLDEVAAGTREIYLTHKRFKPYQSEIEIEGKRIQQNLDIQLEPAWAMLTVTSLPTGAEVSVDDELAGLTPVTIEVIEGLRSLKIHKPGYKSWQNEMRIEAGVDQQTDEIVLLRSDGKLNVISTPTGANITISGQYYGQTPLSIALPPSTGYKLLATKAGYESANRLLNILPEQDQSINLNLDPVVGLIKLAVTPEDATLFINDKARGTANQTLELSARSHELRIELPGHATYATTVIPQPGYPQQLNIVLQTEEEAKVSSTPQQIQTSLGDTLRFIIPGDMTMGAGRREPGRRSNEVQKTVSLTRPFYIGESEISNKSFKAFRPGHDSGLLGRALLSEDDRPAVNMSWSDAAEFCNWLSDQQGLPAAYEQVSGKWQLKKPVNTGYRLPTEAEWAWVARYANGPEPTRFPWGQNMPPVHGSGNFADVSAINMVPYSLKNYNDNYRGPAPSGKFGANALGIHDLAGNVSEWITDHYSVDLGREVLTDPTGPGFGEYHVIRGSNYTHGRFSELRWTWRDYGAEPRPDVGFRIARYVE